MPRARPERPASTAARQAAQEKPDSLAGRTTGAGEAKDRHPMTRAVPEAARALAAELQQQFDRDAELAKQLNDAHRRLSQANDRLWWGIHPDGLAAIYEEHPVAVDIAFTENRSEVLGAPDPLGAAQRVHWQIHRAFIDYQTVADERRQLAADTGETICQFLDALVAAGWAEQQARNANVDQLAGAGIQTRRLPTEVLSAPKTLRDFTDFTD